MESDTGRTIKSVEDYIAERKSEAMAKYRRQRPDLGGFDDVWKEQEATLRANAMKILRDAAKDPAPKKNTLQQKTILVGVNGQRYERPQGR